MGVRVVVDRTLGSRGAYNPKTGEVRVNTDAHKSMPDLERTMAHEIVGHKGIHSLLGRSLDKACGRVSHLIDSEADKALDSLFRNWGTMSRRERGAEYMAWLAGKAQRAQTPQTQPITKLAEFLSYSLLSRRKIVNLTILQNKTP